MRNLYFYLCFILLLTSCNKTQNKKIEKENTISLNSDAKSPKVLTLGTFHFDFPNRDIKTYDSNEQIDILTPKYQKEIEDIVDKLAKFKPTHIAIEIDPSRQKEYDSIYSAYLNGNYKLEKDEAQQIGFRLAKKMNLKRLDCVNDWEYHYNDIYELMKDTVQRKQFINYFYNNPDFKIAHSNTNVSVFKSKGILKEFKRINTRAYNTKSLGDYFLGVFKYETPDNKNFGVDFTTGWWFNRNLKILRNIQRLNLSKNDRILVIYGSGHMNLLNPFFEASPEFELEDVGDYLK